jgi:hypothetical protein
LPGRSLFEAGFFVAVAACLLAARLRWAGPRAGERERTARRDATLLSAVALVADLGALARERLLPGTPGFYALSAVLAPFAIAALILALRLLAAYRAGPGRPAGSGHRPADGDKPRTARRPIAGK